MVVAVSPGMECYFGSLDLPKDNQIDKSAIVLFNIPQIGIRFKAPFDAVDQDHLAYASLLALLEFIDSNQKYVAGHSFQIYGNNLNVINQINLGKTVPSHFRPLLEKAKSYRQKLGFSLQWVPSRDNPAYESNDPLFD
jgi:hypothetical protein